MPQLLRVLLLAVGLATVATTLAAQGTDITFGGLKQDTKLPVEVSADQLSVNQADGSATFSGNVIVVQGEMRLTAASVRVEYADPSADGGPRKIAKLHASGGVTLVSATEAAESKDATYTIESGLLAMTGSVLLTQGQNAISGEVLSVDLKTGAGTMSGRVKTVLQTGGGN